MVGKSRPTKGGNADRDRWRANMANGVAIIINEGPRRYTSRVSRTPVGILTATLFPSVVAS